jgi:hypothetical protein
MNRFILNSHAIGINQYRKFKKQLMITLSIGKSHCISGSCLIQQVEIILEIRQRTRKNDHAECSEQKGIFSMFLGIRARWRNGL